MIMLEISHSETKSHPKLTLKIPKISADSVIVKSSLLPKVSVLANLYEFETKESHLEKVIELDENEIDLNSSAIEFVNYLPTQKALIVKFWNSACYVYYNIPEVMYAFLVIAESKGKVFHQLIQHKYKSKVIPEDFTVSDVRDIVAQEMEEEDFGCDIFNIINRTTNPQALKQLFSSATSIQEKLHILKNPNFSLSEHLEEISTNFWLGTTALTLTTLKEDEKNLILKNKNNHQYYSSPNMKINENTSTKLIIVPQHQMFCTHVSGLDSIPDFSYEIKADKKKLKKGTALMKMDMEGNLELVASRVCY